MGEDKIKEIKFTEKEFQDHIKFFKILYFLSSISYIISFSYFTILQSMSAVALITIIHPSIVIFIETSFANYHKVHDRTMLYRILFILAIIFTNIIVFIVGVLIATSQFPTIGDFLSLFFLLFIFSATTAIVGWGIALFVSISVNSIKYRKYTISTNLIKQNTVVFETTERYKSQMVKDFFPFFAFENRYAKLFPPSDKRCKIYRKKRTISHLFIGYINNKIFIFPFKKELLLSASDSIINHRDLLHVFNEIFNLDSVKPISSSEFDVFLKCFKKYEKKLKPPLIVFPGFSALIIGAMLYSIFENMGVDLVAIASQFSVLITPYIAEIIRDIIVLIAAYFIYRGLDKRYRRS